MKKIILGLFVAVFAAAGATATSYATPPTTDVTGVVTEKHVPVANATVKVTCNGNTQWDTTDAHGSYLVMFPAGDCPFGSTVKVVAEKNGKSGVASGTVRGITTKLNLAIVNVDIPEFGAFGAAAAGGLGIGTLAYMRRRQKNGMKV